MKSPHHLNLQCLPGWLTLVSVLCWAACSWSAPPEQTSSHHASEFAPSVAPRAWKYLVIHHSASTSGSVESIDALHRERTDSAGRPWRGIGYHFVIGNGQEMEDGEIQPTFRWQEQQDGAHAGQPEFNRYGIGICLIGNFEESAPTPAQLQAARKLVAQLQHNFQMSDEQVLRHGDLKATACPGKLFQMETIVVGELPPATNDIATVNSAVSQP